MRKEKWRISQSGNLKTRPCRKCGVLFNTLNCNACQRIRQASRNPQAGRLANVKYYAAHPELMRARAKKYRLAHPEKIKAYFSENSEREKIRSAKWRASHSEDMRIHQHNYVALKKKNGGTLSKGLSAKLFELQKGKCSCCGQPLGHDYHLDHKMPVSLGGANEDSNIQLLHQRCNQRKHAKHPIDFMQSLGFLL